MFRRLGIAVFPIFLVLLGHFVTQSRIGWPALEDRLIGADSYTRMTRAGELAGGGNWYDRTIARSNAPYGEDLHWTRPLDILIVSGAFALSPIAGPEAALRISGALVNPILHLLTLLVLLWAAEAVFPVSGRVYVGILFATQFFLSHQFAFGRPDHHGLIILTLAFLVGAGLRLTDREAGPTIAVTAGFAAALGVWVGIEGLFGAGLVMALLWGLWIRDGQAYAKHGCAYALALTLGAALALILEYPPAGWAIPRYDTLSVVHIYLLALTAVFWLFAAALPGPTKRSERTMAVLAFGAVGLTLFLLTFPKFILGPLVDVDPAVIAEWFNNNLETQPLIRTANLQYSIQRILLYLGTALIGVPFLIYILRDSERLERRYWLFLAAGFILSLVLSLQQLRWAGHVQLFALFPVVGLLLSLLDIVNRRTRGLTTPVARAAVVLLIAVGPAILGFALQPKQIREAGKPMASCDVKKLADYLNNGQKDIEIETIMTFNAYGPELLYRTRHRVVTTPYHRNAAGILDGFRFMRTNDPAVAKAIVKERGVTLIIICPGNQEASAYQRSRDGNSFYKLLAARTPPEWLQLLQTQEVLGKGFTVYRVVQ